MKPFIVFHFLFFLSIITSGQVTYNYNATELIFNEIVKTIDSTFTLGIENKTRDNFEMIRIIDKTGKYFLTSAKGYLNKAIPFIVINKYPFDVNSKKYIDIIVVNSSIENNIETITIISLINISCDQLPITVTKTFYINGGKIIPLKTKNIMVIDDWNPYFQE